jgi:hypothetical protein
MRRTYLLLAAICLVGGVMADDKPLDVTITVVESPGDLPATVTRTIELPPAASDRARERAQHGLETANEARALGREFGQSIAEEAKSKGKGKAPGRP